MRRASSRSVSSPSAGRFYQNGGGADLGDALYETVAGFAGADVDVIFACHQSLYLRAGAGVFAANLIFRQNQEWWRPAIYARARTWLRNEMLEPRQSPLPPAAIAEERSVAALLFRMARAANAGDQGDTATLGCHSHGHGVGPALIKVTSGPLLPSGEQSTGCRGGRRADRICPGRSARFLFISWEC